MPTDDPDALTTADALEDVAEALTQGNKRIAQAIGQNFTSPNELDRNLESANVVDGLFAIARSLAYIGEMLERLRPAEVKGDGRSD
jgi:hypothetical protein